jgi:hypothetical protein
MVSAYAQSGKLFGASFRLSNAENSMSQIESRSDTKSVTSRRVTGNNGKANSHTNSAKLNECETNSLNRLPQSHKWKYPILERPSMIDCIDDIPMSQITEDCSSGNLDSNGSKESEKNVSLNFSGHTLTNVPKRRPDLFGITRHQNVKVETPRSSRFHHLMLGSQKSCNNKYTHRPEFSPASYRASFETQTRLQYLRRPSTESTLAQGHSVNSYTRDNQPKSMSILQNVKSCEGLDVQGGAKEPGDIDLPRSCVGTSVLLTKNDDSILSSKILSFQNASDKIVQDQLKKLEETYNVMQKKLTETCESCVDTIKEANSEVIIEVNSAKKSAIVEIAEEKKKSSEELQENAEAIRKNYEQEWTGFLQHQRSKLIESCLPFLKKAAQSIISESVQNNSFISKIFGMLRSGDKLSKNEIDEVHSSPSRFLPENKHTIIPLGPSPVQVESRNSRFPSADFVTKVDERLQIRPQKFESKSSEETQAKNVEKINCMVLRRSLRNARNESLKKVNETRTSTSYATPSSENVRCKKAVKQRANMDRLDTPFGVIGNTRSISLMSQEGNASRKKRRNDEKQHCRFDTCTAIPGDFESKQQRKGLKKKSIDCQMVSQRDSFANEIDTELGKYSTPKKRKRMFGRADVGTIGIPVSPESSSFSGKKKRTTSATKLVPVIKKKDSDGYVCHVHKVDMHSVSTPQRGPAVVEDVFEFLI